MDTPDSTTQVCIKCKREYPLTAEFWYARKNSKHGLRLDCKECTKAMKRASWAKHGHKYNENRRETRRSSPEEVRQYFREWRNAHRDKLRVYFRRYYRENSAHLTARYKGWAKAHPATTKASLLRRAARKRSLPNTLTAQQWANAISYFNGCCAVCGRQLNDLFGERVGAGDHWIPLASPECPGTTVGNIVPMCHGVDGCNNHKSDRHPEEWIIERFGKRKGHQIIARIRKYFEWAIIRE